MKRTLKKLCDIYVRLRSPKRRREIAGQIQNLDSGICLIQRGEAAVILAAAYLYYRAELDSVVVSAEIRIKPPAVRQILWKMNKLWEREFAPTKQARRTPKHLSLFASGRSLPIPIR